MSEKIEQPAICVVGLGEMGSNVVKNFASQGLHVGVYDIEFDEMSEYELSKFVGAEPGMNITYFKTLAALGQSQEISKILFLVQSGEAFDICMEELEPHIAGGIVIDAGNSEFEDSSVREIIFADSGIRFMAMGISGGKEGSRNGASIMLGGTEVAYEEVLPILKLLAAKDGDGGDTIGRVGSDSAGHFVKMALKGIEYSEMQLLAEIYQFHRDILEYSNFKIADSFNKWNMQSSSKLLSTTIEILAKEEDGDFLLNQVMDIAEGRGSGATAANTGVLFGAAMGSISEAVSARAISRRKVLREVVSTELNLPNLKAPVEISENEISGAYQLAQYINHAIGFDMMMVVDEQYELQLDYNEIVRIWSRGSTLESDLMAKLKNSVILGKNLLIMDLGKELVEKHYLSLVKYINLCNAHGISTPALSAALNYLQGLSTAKSGANLIQAQRDSIWGQPYRNVENPDSLINSNWKTI